jgi:DNA-binding PadR family transcriptional regulator
MRGEHLGELEELVLLSVCSLGDGAYGVNVQQLIESRARRVVTLGAVYSALDRLQRKRLLTSRILAGVPERGGRRKRVFAATPAGIEAIEQVRRAREALWAIVDSADA